jgi:hypothetical protein
MHAGSKTVSGTWFTRSSELAGAAKSRRSRAFCGDTFVSDKPVRFPAGLFYF